MLQQCIDSLVQKIQFGVVINFEKVGPDPAPLFSESNKDVEIIDCDKIKDWDLTLPLDRQSKPIVNANVGTIVSCFQCNDLITVFIRA